MNIQMIPRRKLAGLIYRKSHSALKPSLACGGAVEPKQRSRNHGYAQ